MMASAVAVRLWLSRDIPAYGASRTYEIGPIRVEIETAHRVQLTVTNTSNGLAIIPKQPHWYLFADLGTADAGDQDLLRSDDLVTLKPGTQHVSPWEAEFLPKFAWLPIERYHRSVRESTLSPALLVVNRQGLR